MMPINNAARLVPMMFRAQIVDRCQLQYIPDKRENKESDILPWVREWIQEIYPDLPTVGREVQEKEYEINWRMVSNSGVDDAIIRPVIGARGWPYYPGSGMKGVFRRACTPDQANRYCGQRTLKNDYEPGSLRFHGGYPIDDSWQDGLVDIVHPQQPKQVGTEGRSSPSAMISLYRPTLRFGISSTVELDLLEWDEIWQIWEKAIQKGIGGRVSAGYGQTNNCHEDSLIYRCQLKGRGQAAKLLDGSSEFRPNIFRAALRGHALRVFGGLTDANSAQQLVGDLFGSIDRGGLEGLLSLNFIEQKEVTNILFAEGTRWEQPSYIATGEVNWHLTRSLDKDHRLALKKLITGLTHFAMTFGGFGKSWRRADHRLFFEDYYEEEDKPLIGCHWQWADDLTLQRDRSWHLYKLEQVRPRIDKLIETASSWMQLQRLEPTNPTTWRESWHSNNVQVWGRVAEQVNDSLAVEWLHDNNRRMIYGSDLTGRMGQTGRIWHRMYPVIALRKNEADPQKPIVNRRPQFIELFTIFPNLDIPQYQPFLNFLQEEQDDFTKLWGN